MAEKKSKAPSWYAGPYSCMFNPCGIEHLSLCVYPMFFLLESQLQFPVTVFMERDKFRDLNFEILGTLLVALCEVQSNGVSLHLMTIAFSYGGSVLAGFSGVIIMALESF